MQHPWSYAIWITVCCFGVTNCEQETTRNNDRKPLYLMHLVREMVSSYNLRHLMGFVFEAVNNDSRLLPGYSLRVVNGFTQKEVSLHCWANEWILDIIWDFTSNIYRRSCLHCFGLRVIQHYPEPMANDKGKLSSFAAGVNFFNIL